MYKKITISTRYIYPKKQKMAVLNDSIYKNLARILNDRIGKDEFFNGVVICKGDERRVILRATLLVYREKKRSDDTPGRDIKDIVPIWYDCEMFENGKVLDDEFSWVEFKKFLPLNG